MQTGRTSISHIYSKRLFFRQTGIFARIKVHIITRTYIHMYLKSKVVAQFVVPKRS